MWARPAGGGGCERRLAAGLCVVQGEGEGAERDRRCAWPRARGGLAHLLTMRILQPRGRGCSKLLNMRLNMTKHLTGVPPVRTTHASSFKKIGDPEPRSWNRVCVKFQQLIRTLYTTCAQLVHAVTVLVVGVVDGFLQRDPRLVLLGAVVQAPSLGLARVGRERERGHSRFDQATDVRAIPHAYFTDEQSGQRS